MRGISYGSVTQNTYRSVDLRYSSQGGGIAYAIAIKNLCAGKPSGIKPLYTEKVQWMPSTYPSRLVTQGWVLGSQRWLYTISVMEVGRSHIGRGAR